MSQNTDFTIDAIKASDTKGGTRKGFEDVDSREARIMALFESWGFLVRLTGFLNLDSAKAVISGKRAGLGESLTTLDGVKLTLKPGQVIGLATADRAWLCPGCESAHGTGIHPSPRLSAKGLSGKLNHWFWASKTGEVFVFSDTCYDNYVKGQGLTSRILTAKEFVNRKLPQPTFEAPKAEVVALAAIEAPKAEIKPKGSK